MGFEMYLIDAKSENSPDGFAGFQSHCPFGNLGLKYKFIFHWLDLLNEIIKEIHRIHTINHERSLDSEVFGMETFFTDVALGMRFASELKILTDEMISFNCVVEYYKTNKMWPKKIDIDCIGRLLESKVPLKGYDAFYQNYQVLVDINGIGNAVKHSFINTNVLFVRRYQSRTTILYALYQKQNDQKNEPEFIELEMPKLVQGFNKLISEYKDYIKSNYKIL